MPRSCGNKSAQHLLAVDKVSVPFEILAAGDFFDKPSDPFVNEAASRDFFDTQLSSPLVILPATR